MPSQPLPKFVQLRFQSDRGLPPHRIVTGDSLDNLKVVCSQDLEGDAIYQLVGTFQPLDRSPLRFVPVTKEEE